MTKSEFSKFVAKEEKSLDQFCECETDDFMLEKELVLKELVLKLLKYFENGNFLVRLKNLLKKLNRRNQKNLHLPYLCEMTGMTKEECIKEKLALIRSFSFLEKYSTAVKPLGYWCSLIDPEIGGDHSHIRIQLGEKWYEYIEIYHHRGILFDDGYRSSQSWGIVNITTRDEARFDTLKELIVYIDGNYEKYGLRLNN